MFEFIWLEKPSGKKSLWKGVALEFLTEIIVVTIEFHLYMASCSCYIPQTRLSLLDIMTNLDYVTNQVWRVICMLNDLKTNVLIFMASCLDTGLIPTCGKAYVKKDLWHFFIELSTWTCWPTFGCKSCSVWLLIVVLKASGVLSYPHVVFLGIPIKCLVLSWSSNFDTSLIGRQPC